MSGQYVTGPDPLIGLLLPDGVAAAENFGPLPEIPAGDGSFAEERVAVAKAVDKRKREHFDVRNCARRALAELGLPPVPILSGPHREPLWPDGVIGSMTHCNGYRAAAVARAGRVVGVGLDAEPHGPLPDGVIGVVTRPEEREHLDKVYEVLPAVHWNRVLFSAKESVYKTWYPLTQCWLGFEQAALEFETDPGFDSDFNPDSDPGRIISGSFTAQLFRPELVLDGRQVDQVSGRWLVGKGLVLTAVALVGAG
jgi:4'-phosphopantetheinyl transferase EntD